MFSGSISSVKLPLLLVCALSLLLIIQSCNTPNDSQDSNNVTDCRKIIYPPSTKSQGTVSQGVWGDVWFWEGNFQPDCFGKITPVERKIYIYEATPRDSVVRVGSGSFYSEIKTNLIKIVTSNPDGFFEVVLDTGVYSFFVKENTLFYANGDDGKYIRPAYVVQDSLSHIQIDITYKATF